MPATMSDSQREAMLPRMLKIMAGFRNGEITRCEIKKEGGETVCLTKKSTYQAAC